MVARFASMAEIEAGPRFDVILQKTNANHASGVWGNYFNVGGEPTSAAYTTPAAAPTLLQASIHGGYPDVPDLGGPMYLTGLDVLTNLECRLLLVDVLLGIGGISASLNAVTPLGPLDYASRTPFKGDGITRDYGGLEIWTAIGLPLSGAGGIIPTVNITYTNQAGVGGRVASRSSFAATSIGFTMDRIPLQIGDTGVRSVESVEVTGGDLASGVLQVFVVRRLSSFRAPGNFETAGAVPVGPLETGLPQIFPDCALAFFTIRASVTGAAVNATLRVGTP